FNIQSSIDQTLGLDIRFYDINGQYMPNNIIHIDSISLNASKIINYQKEFSLDFDKLKGVSKIALFLFTPGTDDLGTVLINNYSAVLEYTNEKSNQIPELIEGQPIPDTEDTVITTTKYLGQRWLKMTSTGNTQYRGLRFMIYNPDKILAMANYPVKINFNIQSSIDQTLGLD
ncbi:hypothetical protein QUD64_13125, partial [Lactococcus cremoris]|uniref:hypothetical protein n=1 Tax=Lactococcus lactis subsp. cremoris TaxID=1359 RepID=UPI0025A2F52F